MSAARATLCFLLSMTTSACGVEAPVDVATQAEPPPEPPVHPPALGPPRGRTIYVPAYSWLPAGDGRTLLRIVLSVRNIDPSATVNLTQIDYYDTNGHRVRSYLDAPRPLGPLETADFSVETLDETGGSGANFLVYWEGASDAHTLLTETIMTGHVGAGYLSFTSRGVEIERGPGPTEPPASTDAPPAP